MIIVEDNKEWERDFSTRKDIYEDFWLKHGINKGNHESFVVNSRLNWTKIARHKWNIILDVSSEKNIHNTKAGDTNTFIGNILIFMSALLISCKINIELYLYIQYVYKLKTRQKFSRSIKPWNFPPDLRIQTIYLTRNTKQ